MRSLFGYQRGGPVRGGAYREQPNLPSRGDPVQDAVDTAVGGGTPDLPPGVEPGGQYFTDPITGNPMYQPPMPKSYPGQAQAMVMPQPIDLTTYKGTPDYSKGLPPFDPSWWTETTTAPVFPSTTTEPGMDTVGPAGTVIDPVQAAVDAAVGGGAQTQYGPADNWGEPGYTAYDPVVDVLPTAGAGAGGDPRTDFAPINNLFEPSTGDPYPVGIIDPNVTTPVTGADPNAPGPDPTFFDYDTGTYTPPATTTGVGDMPTTNAVGDMTVATGGFPDNPAEGQQFTDANGTPWIFIQGEWVNTLNIPLPGDTTTPPVTTDPTVTDPTVTDPTVTDPTVTDPTVTDPTVTDPTVTDPTVTDPTVTDPTVTDPTVTGESEVDKLNALVAELRAKQEAERAAWAAQQAEATQKYTLTGPSIGYNPYVSGQYQSDPYGAAGVPDLGGLTTIPTPAPWQPPTLQPWQPPTSTSNPWGK